MISQAIRSEASLMQADDILIDWYNAVRLHGEIGVEVSGRTEA